MQLCLMTSTHRRRRARPAGWRGCVAPALMLLALGCAGDAAVAPPPVTDAARVYWALTLDHHAVTLSTVAPYDTIRLTATPRTLDGTPIDSLPAPTYTSLDLDRAQVSADGLVRVIKSGKKIPVMATLTVGNLRHADTVFINATTLAAPPALDTLSIHPTAGDSAKTAMDNVRTVPAHAVAADGTPISGLSVYYESLNPTTATIDRATGLLSPVHPGHVMLVATATAYGITRSDTLRYAIGYAINAIIQVTPFTNASGQVVNGFVPQHVVVGPGAIIGIFNTTQVATDVTFDDPTNVAQDDRDCAYDPSLCGTGNIEPFAYDSSATSFSGARARRFPVPGTYTYHSTIFGTTGSIEVVDEPAAIP